MMAIGSVAGTDRNMHSGRMGMDMQTDPVSRNIQNQIANAKKRLKDISSNEEMTPEEKMKKRQEIQQEIASLNQQLRQHEIEQRREKQPKGNAMDDMLAGGKAGAASPDGQKGIGHASMKALILADASMKQAQVSGSVVSQMDGRAGVLESEIKQDAGRGISVEKKKEELADIQQKAQDAKGSQISALSSANKEIEEAREADRGTGSTQGKEDKERQAAKAEGKVGKAGKKETDGREEQETTVENAGRPFAYKPVDIRL